MVEGSILQTHVYKTFKIKFRDVASLKRNVKIGTNCHLFYKEAKLNLIELSLATPCNAFRANNMQHMYQYTSEW